MFKRFLLMFKKLLVNIPLVEAWLKIPEYTMFMKDLVTKKRTMYFETVEVSNHCRVLMSSNLVVKKEDPGEFTIP